MQINRLFEIVYILLNKEKATARELSEHFEVSTRTIYRDVEILSSAGIPIYMSKGKGGGISLLPHFVLNKAILTDTERSSILSALQGLNMGGSDSVQNTLSKLGLLFGENTTSFIEIDYSDWGSQIKEQFELAKKAILSRKLLTFDYISSQNQATERKVEPYVLWFKDKTWYLKCFCIHKQELRTFRLTRMKNTICTEETYIPRKIETKPSETEHKVLATKVVVRIDASQKYRIYDDFANNTIAQNDDGSYTVTMNFIEDEWLYGYLLSFGSSATVLEPERIKNIIKKSLQDSLKNYL